MFLIFRETLVLCLGVIVAAAAATICRLWGNKLELLPGVVVPILFCLGRASLVSNCPKIATAIRRVLYQLLRAFALIMLFLFEIGVGLFIDAKDIPMAVWAVIGGFGVTYIAFVYFAESMQTSEAANCTIGHNNCIQRQ